MAELTQNLPKESWRRYFDDLSKRLGTTTATVEIDGPDVGAQLAGEHVTVTGLTYDNKADALMIALDAPGGRRGEAERIVDRPQRILVDGDFPETGIAIAVDDAEGRRTILTVRRATPLPPADTVSPTQAEDPNSTSRRSSR